MNHVKLSWQVTVMKTELCRHTFSNSHIFCTTLTCTCDNCIWQHLQHQKYHYILPSDHRKGPGNNLLCRPHAFHKIAGNRMNKLVTEYLPLPLLAADFLGE